MNSAELLSLLQKNYPKIQEIPYPTPPATAPAHEAKPYRDPYLYISVPAAIWKEVSQFLYDNEQLSFNFLTFTTAIDYLKPMGTETPHIDLVYHLYSFRHRHKCVVKVSLPREDSGIPSVSSLWEAADWQEREVFDMFGVQFKEHPNPKRILMWEGFSGWPLRKDYVHIPDRYDD